MTMFVYIVKWDIAYGDYEIVGVYSNAKAALRSLDDEWAEAVNTRGMTESDLDDLGEMTIQNSIFLTEAEKAIRYPWRGMLISKEIIKED